MSGHEFSQTVVIAAANSWDGVRMADRQLAERLSRHAPVLYVDPPQSVVSRFRERGLGGLARKPWLRRIGPGLARLSPEALPGFARPAVATTNARAIAAQVRWAVGRLGGTIHSTIEANVLMPVMGRCGEQQRVYWAQDDFVGLAPLVGQDPQAFARADEELASAADVIIAANPSVAQALRQRGHVARLIPFGCDDELFGATAAPAADVRLAAPMAVFMGHLGDRIDLDILEAVAGSGVSLLVVGPFHPRTDAERFTAVLNRPNVQWVGERGFEDLPRYLARAEVGILPYTHSRFNTGSFPLKTLEYLAAGLPVVATGLPAISWLGTEHIDVAEGPAAFREAVAARLARGRDIPGDAERRAFAARHSWAARAAEFADAMSLGSSIPAERR
ncbi:glycosyltransferase [Specibacter sp. RAF43]|uniref:glycosyltransferase n=1 Tax=Specibacter sp. RAF43 TaxID=3233057 RepID=UPI003F943A8A